ncbi:transporter, NhaC family [Caloramator quimbayensis]|uniref:Transporter, NhaC family n=1 Tax=Caloramator quimbayensis TaxID=1147123 RepID=A0A1T4Y6I8_9CLOT|nr:Na+/H+ antiporter NhaC family protein [Caloramator quimbayensis]SKA96911.1 transporter, NhaC family [Caloramator quimbayensis]
MDILLSISITFFVLILSIYKGIFVGYPLILGFLIFAFISFRRGFKIKEIIRMSIDGGKKSFVVLKILVLIGAITGIWMAAGTVPAIIYYGIKYMNPSYFILYSFLISCIVSLLLGSSLATVSTVGIALALMAKNTNININIIAGSIISGAYFGDRCSPMSSSANLVANITKTSLYTNIKNMFRTAIIPFILSIIIYFIISIEKPVNFIQTNLSAQILQNYKINIIVLLPAIIILIFSILKIDVKISMLISIILASSIALMFQKYTLYEVLKFLVIGFNLPPSNPLYHILKGGGIIAMWKAAVVIFISCALSGIFNETNILKTIEEILKRAKTRYVLFIYTAIVSVSTAAFGCNQSISIILTNNLMNKNYIKNKIDNHQLAVDIENTAVVLSALIPWNIAAFVPTTTLGVSSIGFIPYAFYLYLLPIIYFLYLYISCTRYKKFAANNFEYKH